MNKTFFTPALLLTLALAGCARSDYQRPELALPANWATPLTGTTLAQGARWWDSFNDPQLSALIDKVLKKNNDLAVAALKVRAALAQSGLADRNLFPDLSAGVDASRQKSLDGGKAKSSYSASLGLSYEVDLWGRLSAVRDSAAWQAQASEYDRQAAALALVASTAQLYWHLGYLNQAISDGKASIAYAQQSLDLVEVRYKAGAVSALERYQARQALASQQAALADLERQRAQDGTALAILFDQGPEVGQAEPQHLPEMALPAVPAGLPADLLARRPDLMAAEARLKASLADVDQVTDSFYPKLSLTGSLGSGSTALSELLQNPVATLGAGLALPFIQWKTRDLNIQVAQNQYQQAVLGFRQRLFGALKEVEDSLSARDSLKRQGEALATSLAAAKEAERIAEVRYRSGATDVQLFLDQQEKRRSAQLALAQNHYQQLANLMGLYQALGGGAEKAPAA
ncbi:efflux transporter outer membrane subunit [Gallaecimonas kandeliae]|uniref:efflux transporter outer membrane subunit n=1 Tax=Gallaecimonas kandeliae TaxID=3029055 RepID=UPI002647F47F|nr:efflux transporter outer membrane subunit [Gallaecimonas kandeliae]WKE64555.1 efflux transporter outer membrane subunit [Gallaecimonas kandeliae]